MKIVRTLALLAFFVAGSVPAFADPTVTVEGAVATTAAKTLGLATVGQKLFVTQETVHSTVTSATGVTVDHYYAHVVVGGADLPVDPFRLSN